MAQASSVPSPGQTVKADMSPESPIAPYPPPDARAYASVLLRLQQGLAFAFLLVQVLRFMLLPDYGLTRSNPLLLSLLLGSGLVFLLPWYRLLARPEGRAGLGLLLAGALWAFVARPLAHWDSGWVTGWIAIAHGAFVAVALAGLTGLAGQTKRPRPQPEQPEPATGSARSPSTVNSTRNSSLNSSPNWSLNPAQWALLLAWLGVLALSWWAAFNGPGAAGGVGSAGSAGAASPQANWMLRDLLGTLAVFATWCLGLLAWRSGQPWASARVRALWALTALVILMTFINVSLHDWFSQHSSHPFDITARLPMVLVLLVIFALAVFERLRPYVPNLLAIAGVLLMLSLPWRQPAVAAQMLPFAAMVCLLLPFPSVSSSSSSSSSPSSSVGHWRWHWALLAWALMLLSYWAAPGLQPTQLLLHSLSGSAVLLLSVLALWHWQRHALQTSGVGNLGNVPNTPGNLLQLTPGQALDARVDPALARLPVLVGLGVALVVIALGLLLSYMQGQGQVQSQGQALSLAQLQTVLLLAMLAALASFELVRRQALSQGGLRQQNRAQIELLSTVMDISTKGFRLFDAAGRHVWHNPEAERLIGATAQQLAESNLFTFALFVRSGLSAAAHRALAGQGRQVMDYAGAGTYKEDVDVRWVVDRVELAGVPHLLLQTEDLSVQHAEEARRNLALTQQAQSMNDLQQELLLVLDTAWVGLGRVQDNRFLWVNREFAQMLGYEAHELLGQPTRLLYASEHAHAQARQQSDLTQTTRARYASDHNYEQNSRASAMLTQLAHAPLESEFEVQYRRRDGQTRVFQARSRYLDTSARESIFTIRDVTQERAQTAQLQQALKDAQAASEAKSNFLSTMSHEVRTPLNGVMGSLQMLALMRLPERASKLVKVGYETSQLLLAVLNDVLDYSRMTAGKMVLDPQPHSLLRCLRSVEEMLTNVPLKPGVALSFTLEEALDRMVLVDELRLRQVLMNLVNNAIKFTEGGAVQVRAASLGSEDGQLRAQISVIDTGIGMDEATLARLYEPFMQGSQGITRKYQGTGLGLVIVQNLVQAMGGKISVHSIVGVGSTFTVELSLALAEWGVGDAPRIEPMPVSAAAMAHLGPNTHVLGVSASASLNQPAPSPAPAPAPAQAKEDAKDKEGAKEGAKEDAKEDTAADPEEQAEQPLLGMQVAVVDDRSVNRMMARTMLEQAGALVHEFADGSELLRGLRMPGASIQAVLMDLQMEPMDGLEATRLIRAETNPKLRNLPILAMTGNLMRNEQELTEQAGMNGFLSKPLLYQDMVRQLRSKVWGVE